MKQRNERMRSAARRRFDRAMVDSTDLLAGYLEGIDFSADPSGFLLYELGRLVEEGKSSFRNEEFRFVIEQGIRLHVDPNVRIRAEMAGRLRRARSRMPSRARRITPEVIGAIEDTDFSLDRIGAVVRAYTNRLFAALEDATRESSGEDEIRSKIERWKNGSMDRADLVHAVRQVGVGAVPAVTDLLFESLDRGDAVDLALELLGVLEFPLAARVLAYMISEPILEEAQEERARSLLKSSWPLARGYILYRLRQHSHEDIPYRWLELLVEMQDERAVDRILEEVVAHAQTPGYKEDLLTILALLDRTGDPGVVGKVLRLMTEESAPEAPLDLLEEWLEGSSLAEPVEEALERWNKGKTILVPASEDFNAFAAHHPDCSFEELWADWTAAYHQALGWQQQARFPRGPIEKEYELELEDSMMRELSLNPGLDEADLRDQIETFRESWLVTPRNDVVPLLAIYLERPRANPWNEAVYWREINYWYVRAAQHFDEGNASEGRRLLDIVRCVEPDYPLARMLDDTLAEIDRPR